MRIRLKKDLGLLKNWRPVSLLNVDYKILTKVIALRLEKILPKIASSSQSGYIKGRFIGESIRLIKDVMDFTKQKELPGIAVFLDFEKAFGSIEWDFLQKCLQTFNFGPQLRRWVSIFYNNITSCVLNNGYASNHFTLERGVRQDCPLSGMLFIIAIEVLQPVSKRVETLLVKNSICDIFILLPCIAPFPPDQCCPNFRIIFKLLGSNFEMGRGVQNKIYMFIFEARAYL